MMKNTQRGGTFLGFIMGLVLGLGLSLAVAIYVTKVPTPFSNKNQPRSSEQDSAEAQKNKDWNPNTVFQPKAPAEVPASPAATSATSSTATPTASPSASDKPADKAAAEAPKAEPRPAVTADPLGDLAVAKAAAKGNVDPFDYFVQAGAFRTQADADAQRAKLAMMGWEARVSEREQNGRAVFRVRVGPFTKRDDAEQLKEKLDGAGLESALVRVQR